MSKITHEIKKEISELLMQQSISVESLSRLLETVAYQIMSNDINVPKEVIEKNQNRIFSAVLGMVEYADFLSNRLTEIENLFTELDNIDS